MFPRVSWALGSEGSSRIQVLFSAVLASAPQSAEPRMAGVLLGSGLRKEAPTVGTGRWSQRRPTASAGPPHTGAQGQALPHLSCKPEVQLRFQRFLGQSETQRGHPVPTPSLTPYPLSFLNKQITSPSQARGDVTPVHRHSHLIRRPHGLQCEPET